MKSRENNMLLKELNRNSFIKIINRKKLSKPLIPEYHNEILTKFIVDR